MSVSLRSSLPTFPSPRSSGAPYWVTLVCLGNICRSPMAEVVLRETLAKAGLSAQVAVDSAGTGDWHVGDAINDGARDALRRRGYDGTAHRARQIQPRWLPDRDLLLAMDRSNQAALLRMGADPDRVLLFGQAGGLAVVDVPDPYGGGPDVFDEVLDLIEAAAPRIADRLPPAPAW
ncbi:MAG TPA: low molecular weight protein-tyrosine-phosphatase [Streptosporangiaceae bacterium]|nr:low molecular weight protein-tyrosine-phosphatase [Streptosporangiaceae bacterium]